MALDGTGYVYITGYTDGILDNGSVSGDRDVFVAKYNTSGTQQWIKQLGDTYSEGKEIVADSTGNVYVTGYTYGDFDGNQNLGSKDIIIVKYNSSGTKQWTKQMVLPLMMKEEASLWIVLDISTSRGNLWWALWEYKRWKL